jgi:predicted dehydrogenase
VISVGVIGYGYWGPNLARNFSEIDETGLGAVSDLSESRLSLARRRFPACQTCVDYRDILNDPSIDAVAVATPVSSHYAVTMEALAAGKHVLVTKPMASSSEQAQRMIDEARRRGRVLMVDHTFCYTGAVRCIRELIRKGELGDILYYDSVRVNLGLFAHDVDVIWDLAVHDLSIMDHVLPSRPVEVSATGLGHFDGGREDISYVTLFFESNMIAHLHVNWMAPVKVRRTLLGGSRKMIVYDDLETSDKVKVYDKGVSVDGDAESVYRMLVSYRTGDMWAPRVDLTEALQTECRHFALCIEQGLTPDTDGAVGLEVVRVLEAASLSMKERGRPVKLVRDTPA